MEHQTDRRLDPDYLSRSIRDISDQDVFQSLSSRFNSYQAWANHWKNVSPTRAHYVDRQFFLGTRAEVLTRLTPDRNAILTQAIRIMDHDIQGWGDVSIRHGPIVDFNADYGQSGQYGFHYWWWAQPLIHAHLLTGEHQYLSKFDQLFNQWFEQRNAVRGQFPQLNLIWYELGLGLRNRVFLEYYTLPFSYRSLLSHERLLKTLLGAARWLYQEQLRGYRDGNWQIMGAYGLAFIATLLPEFLESSDWLHTAITRLTEHADQDFFPDGCHSERVPSSYSIVAYRDLRNIATLLSTSDKAAPFHQRLTQAIQWFRAIMPPDRILPAINDGERAPIPPHLAEDMRRFGAETQSVHLPASGFTIMRSGASPDARYMLINHGPHAGGHSHADCLSFQLHVHGHPLAIDAGIGRTYDDPLHTSWYVRSIAHNMLTVDGDNLDRLSAVGQDVVWNSQPNLEFFAATHRGYLASKGVLHRRHIAFVRHEYWVIYDVIDLGHTDRDLSWEIHLSRPGLTVLSSSDQWRLHQDTGWASVRGSPGYDQPHAEIQWKRFQRRASAGSTVTIGVLLFPSSPSHFPKQIQFTGDTGQFIVQAGPQIDELIFSSNGVQWRDISPQGPT